MLAPTDNWTQFLILAGAGVVGAFILGIGRAGMGLVRTRQAKVRADESDARNLSTFFFDQPRDSRTGTPATVGWTTKVDATLDQLTKSQAHTTKILNEILYEVKPNGGGNLRGAVDVAAQAATDEVKRVRRNEDEANG